MGLRATLLAILSVLLIISDTRYHCFSSLRSTLALIVAPIQYVVNLPSDIIDSTKSNVASKHSLMKENNELRSELLILQARTQRLNYLEQENAQLRALLSATKQFNTKVLAAQLLDIASDNFNQQATINKGKHQGLYVGQPVLDAYGVIGQVIFVGLVNSKVLLASDVKSAIPVMVVRNGMQSIAVGVGRSNVFELTNVPETADIKAGDYLVTSGLGQAFPEGYPVGIVESIKNVPGEKFARVSVTPAAHFGQSRHWLLVWPGHKND